MTSDLDLSAVEHMLVDAGLVMVAPEVYERCAPAIRLVPDPNGSCVVGGTPNLDSWPAVNGVPLRSVASLHIPSLREVGEGTVRELELFPQDGWVLLFAMSDDMAPTDGPSQRFDSAFIEQNVEFGGMSPVGLEPLPMRRYRPNLGWSVDVLEVERLAGRVNIDEWVGADAVNRFLRSMYGNPPHHQIGGFPWSVEVNPQDVAVISAREAVQVDLSIPGVYDETRETMEGVWYSDPDSISNPENGRTQGWSLGVQLSADDLGRDTFSGLWWGSETGRAFWMVPPDTSIESAHLVVQAGEVI